VKRVTTKVITIGTLAAVVFISTTAWAITSKVNESAKNKLNVASKVNAAAVDEEKSLANKKNEELAINKDKVKVDLLASDKAKQEELAKQAEVVAKQTNETRLAESALDKAKQEEKPVESKETLAKQSEALAKKALAKKAENKKLAAIAANRAEVDKIVTGWSNASKASKAAKIAANKAEQVRATNLAKIRAANLAKEKANVAAKAEAARIAKNRAERLAKIEKDKQDQIEKDKQNPIEEDKS